MTHLCHWPGCTAPVPPKMWGCKPHWFRLPKDLRDAIRSAYVPGQEITKTPSALYLAVAKRVQDWIRKRIDLANEEHTRWNCPGCSIHD